MCPSKKSFFLFFMIMGVILIGAVAESFSGDEQNLASVDRALLESLQSLKSSMASVENSNQALREENEFYSRKIQMIQNAFAPVVPLQEIPSAKSTQDKIINLTDKRLTGIMEEYKALSDEGMELLRHIEAKESSLKDFQSKVMSSQEQAGVMRQQMAMMESFSGDDFQQQIQDLENLFLESQASLVLQEQQKEMSPLKATAVKAVSGAETANKELWIKMQKLESDLRDLSAQQAKVRENQSLNQSDPGGEIAELEADIQFLSEELQTLQGEIKKASLPKDEDFSGDQALNDYHQRLENQNQSLRQRAATLRNVLSDF